MGVAHIAVATPFVISLIFLEFRADGAGEDGSELVGYLIADDTSRCQRRIDVRLLCPT